MSSRKFTAEEIALIHRTYMDGACKDDVSLFIATCERTGLDPFARQIMPSSRNSQKNGQWVTLWTWIVTIDGLRKIAVDSGDYEGQEGPWWCGKDGVWKEVWIESMPCYAAKVLVHRKGFRTGLSGIAKYDSYVQKKKDGSPNNVWATLGDHMVAKCAEALALRRAYPNEMAGLYTEEESEPIIKSQAPEPFKPKEWDDGEREEARIQVGTLADDLLEWGLEESEIEAIVSKPRLLIGDETLSFDTWANRILALHGRLEKKHKKEIQ